MVRADVVALRRIALTAPAMLITATIQATPNAMASVPIARAAAGISPATRKDSIASSRASAA